MTNNPKNHQKRKIVVFRLLVGKDYFPFRDIKAETDTAYRTIHDNSLHRLLFMDFKTTHESDTAMHWWQQRLDKL
jgi:hypothetical protein